MYIHVSSPFRFMFRDKNSVPKQENSLFSQNATDGLLSCGKRNNHNVQCSERYEKHDYSFSPTTFFVPCATLNVAATTENATAFMVRPTLYQGQKLFCW